MNNQQSRTRSYGSNRCPAFLFGTGEVTLRDGVRIVENESGSVKTNIMLAKVLTVLVLVPCEAHSQPRETSISLGITNVNTFVRTLIRR